MISIDMERQNIACKFYGDKMEVPTFEDLEKDFERTIGRTMFMGALYIWEKHFVVPNFIPNTRTKIDPRMGVWLNMKFKFTLCEYSDAIKIYQGYSKVDNDNCYEEMVFKNIQIEPPQANELKEVEISSLLFEEFY